MMRTGHEDAESLIAFEAVYTPAPSESVTKFAKYVAMKENWPYAPRVGDRLFFPLPGTRVTIERVAWAHDGVAVVTGRLWRHNEQDIEALEAWGFERKERPYEDEDEEQP